MLKFNDPLSNRKKNSKHVYTFDFWAFTIFRPLVAKKWLGREWSRIQINRKFIRLFPRSAYDSAYIQTLLSMYLSVRLSSKCLTFIHPLSLSHNWRKSKRISNKTGTKIRKQITKYAFVWQTFAWQRECCQCDWLDVSQKS